MKPVSTENRPIPANRRIVADDATALADRVLVAVADGRDRHQPPPDRVARRHDVRVRHSLFDVVLGHAGELDDDDHGNIVIRNVVDARLTYRSSVIRSMPTRAALPDDAQDASQAEQPQQGTTAIRSAHPQRRTRYPQLDARRHQPIQEVEQEQRRGRDLDRDRHLARHGVRAREEHDDRRWRSRAGTAGA